MAIEDGFRQHPNRCEDLLFDLFMPLLLKMSELGDGSA